MGNSINLNWKIHVHPENVIKFETRNWTVIKISTCFE